MFLLSVVLGRLRLFADKRKPSWTRLLRTAEVGSSELHVRDSPVNWQPNDRIVIATTSKHIMNSEIHTIRVVNETTIYLQNPLKFRHVVYNESFGAHQVFTGAEVGILESNIGIAGDQDSLHLRYGGHLLVIQTTTQNEANSTYLSGVLFERMGQYGPGIGRCALEFVGSDSPVDQAFVSESIFHNTFATAITVQEGANVHLSGNVIFNSLGSGVRLHGDTSRFSHNLIIQTLCSTTIRPTGALELHNIQTTQLTHNVIAGSACACVLLRNSIFHG
ncbi:hypothetical protein PHET_00290 [Paragonimus heterotremus]|uniref:CEMIP beta-helix domain-containing protein n=1 Tax=Paragonimus heterotremus TaxID=100268 RepID=A0A8J4T570_9TREM|nr:hypothetical protein PHET_00290 [Paragonimus heterotremus]